jgi:hypothetical protein
LLDYFGSPRLDGVQISRLIELRQIAAHIGRQQVRHQGKQLDRAILKPEAGITEARARDVTLDELLNLFEKATQRRQIHRGPGQRAATDYIIERELELCQFSGHSVLKPSIVCASLCHKLFMAQLLWSGDPS